MIDFAPGYTASFAVKCADANGNEYTSNSASFTQGVDGLKPVEDYVHSLPEMEDFPYGVYSGYVPLANSTKEIYYIMTES